MGNVGVVSTVGLGSTVISSSFYPGSVPQPQPLIPECVVEEVKEDGFLPEEQLLICICTFLFCYPLSQKSLIFEQVRLFLWELKGKRVAGGKEQPKGTLRACR